MSVSVGCGGDGRNVHSTNFFAIMGGARQRQFNALDPLIRSGFVQGIFVNSIIGKIDKDAACDRRRSDGKICCGCIIFIVSVRRSAGRYFGCIFDFSMRRIFGLLNGHGDYDFGTAAHRRQVACQIFATAHAGLSRR